jgi:hypothetical protein
MSTLEESPVTYEELADIERDFEDVEMQISWYPPPTARQRESLELPGAGPQHWRSLRLPRSARRTLADMLSIVREQVGLTKELYQKRHEIVSQIPNFWPLVIEQAPPEIDAYIQPSDSALLLSSLTSLRVTHFELEENCNPDGDPRNVAIRWEFSENDYFEDRVLIKKFWHRRAKDGWTGLVSEPVNIRWKKGKDLTGGLLGLVKRVWELEQELERDGKKNNGKKMSSQERALKEKGLASEKNALKKKIENTGLGGLSFFAWFGYRGNRVSVEESELANRKEQDRRRLQKAGKEPPSTPVADEDEDEDGDGDEDEDEEDLEIFPDGDSLAVTITEDLWPGAIKYFSKSYELPHSRSRALTILCSTSSGAGRGERR